MPDPGRIEFAIIPAILGKLPCKPLQAAFTFSAELAVSSVALLIAPKIEVVAVNPAVTF